MKSVIIWQVRVNMKCNTGEVTFSTGARVRYDKTRRASFELRRVSMCRSMFPESDGTDQRVVARRLVCV